ncbi:MAG: septum formation initiator family protein [Nitrospirota bacterium]|nr:septum formation initiator family protein [Nitrospirota bacterium]
MTKKEVETARKKQLTLILMAGGLVVLYIAFSFFFGDMGLVKLYQMWETKRGLQTEIQTLKQENERLGKEVEALRNDPDKIEGVAREKLGMARKGEIIYQYERKAPAESTGAAGGK